MTRPHLHRRIACALTVGAAMVLPLLQGCSPQPGVVRIGVAGPLTGNLGALGQDMANGVKLAADELNRQGFSVDDRPVRIEVVSLDDRADAATGKEVAQQLADAGVVAVVGHLNSGVSIAAAPIYAQHGIPQLAISTNPRLTAMGFSNMFRLVANDSLQARAIASYAADQFATGRFALVDDGSTYGKGLADGVAAGLAKANRPVVLRESFDDKTVAFDALADRLKAGGIDVVVSMLNDFQVLALARRLKAIDHAGVSILGGDLLKTTDALKGIGIVKGLYATSPILDAKEFVNGKPFLEKYRAEFHVEPTYGSAYAYDAVHILSSAMKQTGSLAPRKIAEALHKIDGYAPVTGSMRWTPEGEQRYGVIGVYSARAGAWELQMRSDRW